MAQINFTAPPAWGTWTVLIVIAGICLVLSAFASGSEMAYFGLEPEQREEIEDPDSQESSPATRKAAYLLKHSEQLLATILIANNLVNVTMVVLLSFALSQVLATSSPAVEFLIQTVLLTFLLLLFGEILPKLVARTRAKRWVLSTAPAMTALYRLLSPPARLMLRSTSIVHRVVTKKRQSVSTNELTQALELSDEPAGKDKELLEGILTFGEKQAADIMVSRVDITDIEIHKTFDEVIELIRSTGYSRIPVYDGTQDNVRGILYSKDLLPYIGTGTPLVNWPKLLRQPYFVPESRMIDDLLEDFRNKHIHIAVVVDEYGGTQGIVTLEDIIEEIVGDIDDEYDEEAPLYKVLSDDTYVFEAKIPLADFYRVTGIDEEEFGDTGEAETLAGLLLEIKGDFPQKKESLVLGRCRFLVLDIQKHRIISVRCKVMDEIQTPNA